MMLTGITSSQSTGSTPPSMRTSAVPADDTMEIAVEALNVLLGYFGPLSKTAFFERRMQPTIRHVHGECQHDGAARATKQYIS